MASNQFIARKGIISLDDAQVTGSLSVTGNISASIFTGSFVGDGSQLSGIEGFPFTGSAGITGSLTVVGPVNATTFTGDGSQLTGIEGFPFTGSARITGSLVVVGPVNATSFTGSLQGTATSASYIQLANVDGFTAYSASVNTAIDSVLDATTPLTATVNTTNTPFTLTSQSIVVADSTDGNLTINLPDLNTIVGTPNQKPIIVYKNDYSQNVIYVNPSGSQLVNGASQDIIVSIQLAVIYNPTSAGWVTEGTSAQSLAELELFFLPLTETGSLATTGSNRFNGNQIVTGSLTVTGGINATITGSATSASYVEYANVANKPTLVSGSAQVTYSGLTSIPAGIVSGSSQVTYSGLTGVPSGIVSSSTQIVGYNVFATTGSNQFNGSQAVTGSLTVTGQVVAQTLNVQQVTSSIVYSSGSNIFGNSLGNTQQFTGSLQVSGSSHNILGNVGIGPTGTPSAELQVGKSSDVTIAMSNSSSVTSGNRGSLAWYNSNVSSVATIRAAAVTDNVGTELQFFTRPAAGSLTQVLTLSSTGNLGLGVTPSAWENGSQAFQNSGYALSIFGLTRNAFWNGASWNYITSDFATRFDVNNGAYRWQQAPSGTVGNTMSFTQAMTLTSGGDLLLGTTTDNGVRLQLTGGINGPVMSIQNSSSGGYSGAHILNNSGSLMGHFGFANASTGATLQDVMYFGSIASKPVVFTTADAERMRITSGGNVVMGNNAGSGWSASSTRTTLEIYGGGFPMALHNSTSVGNSISYNTYWDGTNWRYVGTGTSVIYIQDSEGHKFLHNGSGSAGASFTPAERMRITSGGNVQINTTNSPLARLHVADALVSTMLVLRSGNDTATSIAFNSSSPGGSTDNYSISHTIVHGGSGGYQIEHNATARWIRMIAGSGGVELAGTAGSWATISDIRTKDVLQTGISNAIDKIKNLDAIFYKYKNEELLQEGETMSELVQKDKPTKIKQRRVGLIAQQIQEVLPEAVTYNEEEDTYRLSYTEVIPLLVESIKEQQSQIESLKAEIQTLKQ